MSVRQLIPAGTLGRVSDDHHTMHKILRKPNISGASGDLRRVGEYGEGWRRLSKHSWLMVLSGCYLGTITFTASLVEIKHVWHQVLTEEGDLGWVLLSEVSYTHFLEDMRTDHRQYQKFSQCANQFSEVV